MSNGNHEVAGFLWYGIAVTITLALVIFVLVEVGFWFIGLF